MAALQSDAALSELDGPLTPCVRCKVPTAGTLFASANVFTGLDDRGQSVTQWLKPIPVCEGHRRDLLADMSVLSWCVGDEAWGIVGRPCGVCGKTLSIRYRRS
ncbi:MAG TPA: hypothetical protein VGD57_10725 [Candidatus Dormibacteraeota bacterium]